MNPSPQLLPCCSLVSTCCCPPGIIEVEPFVSVSRLDVGLGEGCGVFTGLDVCVGCWVFELFVAVITIEAELFVCC